MKTSWFGRSLCRLGLGLTIGAVLACSSDGDGESVEAALSPGNVRLAVSGGGQLAVSSLSYTVSEANGDVVLSDTVTLQEPTSAVSLQLGLPPDVTYTITLRARTVDGLECQGSAIFFVTAGATQQVFVDLLCDGEGGGSGVGTTLVEGRLVPGTSCPEVSFYSASPIRARVGGLITLSAGVSRDGSGNTQGWSASQGSLAASDRANTTYTCTAAGSAVLTFRVAEGSCSDSEAVTVHCEPAGSGTGGSGGAAGSGGSGAGGSSAGSGGTGAGAAGGAGGAGGSGSGGAAGTGASSNGGSGGSGAGGGTGGSSAGGSGGTGSTGGTGGSSAGGSGGTGGSGADLDPYSFGHADLAFEFAFDAGSNEWDVFLFAEGATIGGATDVDGAFDIDAIQIVSGATFARPNPDSGFFEPLCVAPGASAYWLPQNNTSASSLGAPFMGIENGVPTGVFVGNTIRLSLVSVESPSGSGAYSLWKDGFPPLFSMSSCNGIDASDTLVIPPGHDHFNMAFTLEPGAWVVRYRVSGTLVGGGETSAEFDVNFFMQ